MGNTTLFAPRVSATQPAFIYGNNGGTVTIYYSLSDFNTKEDFSKVVYKVMDPNIQSDWGTNIVKNGIINSNNLSFEIEFSSTDELITDQFYQVQIQLQKDNITSDWSQITLIRPISNYSLEIEGFESNSSQNPSTLFRLPTMLKGKMNYVSESKELVQDIGLQIYNSSTQHLMFRIPLQKNFLGTQFQINLADLFLPAGNYYMCPQIVTINGYTISGQTYKFYFSLSDSGAEGTDNNFKFENFSMKRKEDSGVIDFAFDFKYSESNIPFSRSGKLIILRSDADKDFSNWTAIISIDLLDIFSTEIKWQDFLIEAGNVYRYKIQFLPSSKEVDYNKTLVLDKYSNEKKEEKLIEIDADFEDIFLSDKNSQLAVRYDPKITGLKWVTQDNITNSLGGKYPIIRKNGDTYYRQFSISGTLSFFEETRFRNTLVKDSRGIDMSTWLKEPENSWYSGLNDISNLSYFQSKPLILEKKLRDLALAFLTNGEIKLFRSATEGNMIVYLNNVSFTPNVQLGRNIYSFSATATEVCEATLENIKNYALDTTEAELYYVLEANYNTAISDEDKISVFFPPFVDNNEYIYGEGNLQLVALTKNEFYDFTRGLLTDGQEVDHE